MRQSNQQVASNTSGVTDQGLGDMSLGEGYDFDPTPGPAAPSAAAPIPTPPPEPVEAIAELGDPRPVWQRRPAKPIYLLLTDGSVFDRIRHYNGLSQAGFPVLATTAELVAAHLGGGRLEDLARSAKHIAPDLALQILGELGHVASSLVGQAIKARIETVGLLDACASGFERALLALASRCGVDPRDTAITAWLRNPPFTWTNEASELAYGQTVREVDARLDRLGDLFELLERGKPVFDTAFDIAAAAEQLQAWHVQTSRARGVFRQANFTGFLSAFEVAGDLLQGPTPRQLRSWERVRNSIDRLNRHAAFAALPRFDRSPGEFTWVHRQRLRAAQIDRATQAAVEAAAMIIHVMATIQPVPTPGPKILVADND